MMIMFSAYYNITKLSYRVEVRVNGMHIYGNYKNRILQLLTGIEKETIRAFNIVTHWLP